MGPQVSKSAGAIPLVAVQLICRHLGLEWRSHKAVAATIYAASVAWMLAVMAYVATVPAGPWAGYWTR